MKIDATDHRLAEIEEAFNNRMDALEAKQRDAEMLSHDGAGTSVPTRAPRRSAAQEDDDLKAMAGGMEQTPEAECHHQLPQRLDVLRHPAQ